MRNASVINGSSHLLTLSLHSSHSPLPYFLSSFGYLLLSSLFPSPSIFVTLISLLRLLESCVLWSRGHAMPAPAPRPEFVVWHLCGSGVESEAEPASRPLISRRKTLNTYWDFDLTQENIHNVSGVLKTFLRETESPILPFELMETVIPLFEGCGATEYGLNCLEELIQGIPRPNRCILKRVIGFGAMVAANQKVNRMSIRNVALVLGPSLVRRQIYMSKKVGVPPTFWAPFRARCTRGKSACR